MAVVLTFEWPIIEASSDSDACPFSSTHFCPNMCRSECGCTFVMSIQRQYPATFFSSLLITSSSMLPPSPVPLKIGPLSTSCSFAYLSNSLLRSPLKGISRVFPLFRTVITPVLSLKFSIVKYFSSPIRIPVYAIIFMT